LYVLFASVGTIAAIFAGLFVERFISVNASTVVFLVLFFSDLVLAWIAVVLVMDGNLRDMTGRSDQLEIERQGRQQITH
jgi:hypothetical protein